MKFLGIAKVLKIRVMPNFRGQWPTTSLWRYHMTPAKLAMLTSINHGQLGQLDGLIEYWVNTGLMI